MYPQKVRPVHQLPQYAFSQTERYLAFLIDTYRLRTLGTSSLETVFEGAPVRARSLHWALYFGIS